MNIKKREKFFQAFNEVARDGTMASNPTSKTIHYEQFINGCLHFATHSFRKNHIFDNLSIIVREYNLNHEHVDANGDANLRGQPKSSDANSGNGDFCRRSAGIT